MILLGYDVWFYWEVTVSTSWSHTDLLYALPAVVYMYTGIKFLFNKKKSNKIQVKIPPLFMMKIDCKSYTAVCFLNQDDLNGFWTNSCSLIFLIIQNCFFLFFFIT